MRHKSVHAGIAEPLPTRICELKPPSGHAIVGFTAFLSVRVSKHLMSVIVCFSDFLHVGVTQLLQII